MPFTLTGRVLVYALFIALMAAFLAVVAILAMNFIFWMIGHRRFVPWARFLKFKSDDVKKTSEQVDKILGDKNEKQVKPKKTKKKN